MPAIQNVAARDLQSFLDAGQIRGNTAAFAQSLVRAAASQRGASVKQQEWIDRLVAQARNPVPVVPVAQVENASAIFGLFARASAQGRLKWPKIHLQTGSGDPVVFSRFGERSRYVGQIRITDGGVYGVGVYFGRINAEGDLFATQRMTPEVRTLIDGFAFDPTGVAASYGRMTGNCCFCHRTLETTESLAVGYGPVCAEKYGLPWG